MDLSKMLDDLYHEEEGGSEAKDTSEQQDGPEWADEARLEEVFSTWTPGPPSDAPEAERQIADTSSDADLGAELEGMGRVVPTDEVSPVSTVTERSWTRSDDDVLVGGRGGGLLSRLRR